jgi:hypothetical protein
MNEAPKIFAAISAIMTEVGAVEKTRKNVAQNYSFRGIDDVVNALTAALQKHSVFATPEVLSTERSERPTKTGGTMFSVFLTVKYTFYAVDGSNVTAVVTGEGMDTGDKAANKALSAAFKYALLQVFAIPTEESKDSEYESPEPTSKPNVAALAAAKVESNANDQWVSTALGTIPTLGEKGNRARAEEWFAEAKKRRDSNAISIEQFTKIFDALKAAFPKPAEPLPQTALFDQNGKATAPAPATPAPKPEPKPKKSKTTQSKLAKAKAEAPKNKGVVTSYLEEIAGVDKLSLCYTLKAKIDVDPALGEMERIHVLEAVNARFSALKVKA